MEKMLAAQEEEYKQLLAEEKEKEMKIAASILIAMEYEFKLNETVAKRWDYLYEPRIFEEIFHLAPGIEEEEAKQNVKGFLTVDERVAFWEQQAKDKKAAWDDYCKKKKSVLESVAVLVQWTAPTVHDAAGVRLPKPEETWTVDELKKAKYNSKALSAIYSSVTKKTFELIQGCETAKEAWDLLQLHFEGTQKVQNSRKDMLATRFENLKMEEHESISDLSSKLKSLSQEAVTLGKRYNGTKPVKKFLRCLPAKFMAYKSALNVYHNTEELSFGEVVGMLHAHEMELESATGDITSGEGIFLESDDEDPVSLLARRFDRALRKVEQGQSKRRFRLIKKHPEVDIDSKMSEVQCYECKGFGHFKIECPTVKIQEDSEDVEELSNFVAFLGITEFDEGEELSESESDGEHEDDLIKSYKENLNNVKGVEVTFRDRDHGVLQHKGGDKVRCGSNYKEKHVKDQQKKVHGIESKSVLNGTKKVACSMENSGVNDQSSPKEQSGSAEQSSSE
ncbi:hypothetical protein AALP_AAs44809U000100 [Arabis alpina]|uniref:CCHC-type domain-containing protein n=1 Tax=Arabis alpina TaxID=50452 RepID=A0A087G2V4_ARAAL|nr:hypothetical protein AALP_AAs44809U000100 [Arabis alpina]